MNRIFEEKVIRESAILTASYVASDVRWLDDNLILTDKNQVVLLIDFTKWSLTTMEMKLDFSNNWVDFYQETSLDISSGTATVNLLEYTFNATGKYRVVLPIKDRYIKVSVKWTWTATSSLCKITNITWNA